MHLDGGKLYSLPSVLYYDHSKLCVLIYIFSYICNLKLFSDGLHLMSIFFLNKKYLLQCGRGDEPRSIVDGLLGSCCNCV